MANVKTLLRIHWLPATVLLLGACSVVMVRGIHSIATVHEADMVCEDVATKTQLTIANTHRLLEEQIAGDYVGDVGAIWRNVDLSTAELQSLLVGGVNEHGVPFGPLTDPKLRKDVEELLTQIRVFADLGRERLAHPPEGPDVYNAFHAHFNQLVLRAAAFHEAIGREEVANLARTHTLFWAIMVVWIGLIVASTAGLWLHESRRRQAEESLHEAHGRLRTQTDELEKHRDHLGELVEERTSQLRAADLQLQHLSSKLLTAQEMERSRISKELHDELGGTLAAVKIELRRVEGGLRSGQEAQIEACHSAFDALNGAIDSVSRISFNLSPHVLEELGLSRALRWLCHGFRKRLPQLNVRVDISDVEGAVARERQILLFRIAQEALTNVAKHADAANVAMTLRMQGAMMILAVEDDGQGFDVEQALHKTPGERGMGLTTMRERAQMLGGDLDVTSAEGRGTCLVLTVPWASII